MSPDTVNKFSAELVSIFGGGAPKKGLLGLGGKDYSRVVDIFKQMENGVFARMAILKDVLENKGYHFLTK